MVGDQSRITTVLGPKGRPLSAQMPSVEVFVESGPDAGLRARLEGRVFAIGAHPSNSLVLPGDEGISGFHAQIVVDESGYRVIDRGSANGTFIGDVRVDRAHLLPGQKIRVGHTVIGLQEGSDVVELELSQEDSFGDLVGRSLPMRELFAMARRASNSDVTVLLHGETGTGKDLLARAIHGHSGRSRAPFEVFDCGAVAPNLIESALFGHMAGSFTGASRDHAGVFERANGGTVFLDEIGELDLSLQPKLLRVLENGTVTRVGGVEEVSVDCRVVAATHRDLQAEVEAGTFRSDLYFRLAVLVLEVPSLRERPEDIPLLASTFLRQILAPGDHDFAVLQGHMDEAFGRLSRHEWRGNVRELRNVVERAVVLADPAELEKDLFSRLVEVRKSIGTTLHQTQPLKLAREQFDISYLREVLDQTGGDVQRAASIAQVHPKSFTRLLRRYSIGRDGD